MITIESSQKNTSIIKVIGVGGGGSNAVNYMYKQGIEGVDFVICNTDSQALNTSNIPNKLQLGVNLTEGRGAGSIPQIGKDAALENIEQIKEFFADNTKMVFITAGMGGGTGTGASPVIAKVAKEMGILTVGIVTIPFSFEGKKRQIQAHNGVIELKHHVDTILVISNDKLRNIFGNLSLSNAFSEADNILTTASKGIAEIITLPGYINVDFEDVKTVMANGGVAIMGSYQTGGDNRAHDAVEGALHSPLLDDNKISGAKYILLNITSGNKEVLLEELTEITDYIQEQAEFDADMIWGHCYDKSLGDDISVTIIATGFNSINDIHYNLFDNNIINNNNKFNKLSNQKNNLYHKYQFHKNYINKSKYFNKLYNNIYKSNDVNKIKRISNDIYYIENEPAYKRRKKII